MAACLGSRTNYFVKIPTLFLLAAFLSAGPVPVGSKLYISVMDGQLDGFIAAELIKQKIPVSVVLDDKQADFVLAGASIKADDKWYHVVFGGKD